MKKNLLFLISIFLGAVLTAQIPDLRKGKSAFNLHDKLNSSKGELLMNEKVDSTINETWAGSTWISSGKKKYTYLVNGNTTTVTTLTRDASTAFLWVNSSKTETTVNTGGDETLYISYNWNKITSQWVPTMKFEFSYDGTGKLILDITSLWNQGSSSWVGLSKTEFFYSGSNLSYDISYDWDQMAAPAAWVKSSKSEYTYSGINMIKEEVYEWDATLTVPDWVKSEKTEFTFNANNKLTSEITYKWDLLLVPSPGWVNATKTDYTYDANGRETLIMGYKWDTDLNPDAWANSDKIEYSWDANGRNTMYAFYDWDNTVPGWVGLMKAETTYVTATVNYSVTTGYSWLLIAWASTTRSTSYYSALTTGIGDNKSDLLIYAYPNPASEYITFHGISGSSTVELFDMSGRKVLEQKLPDDGKQPVGSLRKGLYIYRVSANGITYTGRVVLK